MEEEFPKRLFTAGDEPLVDHINNSCRVKLLRKIKKALPEEYGKAMENPVFAPILAIEENFLGYSGKLIHIMLSRQLVTKKKHEIWCVFGGRPLRFSLQEFHAVTGLNCDGNSRISNVFKMKNDTGFWSTLLKDKRDISIKSIINEVLPHVKGWKRLDKIRLVYVGVIAIMLMGFDEKKYIPHMYIKLVMDFDKLNKYPWGHVSFEHLVECIVKTKKKLTNPKSYLFCTEPKTETMMEWRTNREDLNVVPTQTYKAEETSYCFTDFINPVKVENLKVHTPDLKDTIKSTNEDDALVLVDDKSFDKMLVWSQKGKELKFGPSVLDNKSLTRIIGPCEWFQNQDMDAVMYLFRENTSLGRYESDRVAFMNCIFSMQITAIYPKFKKTVEGSNGKIFT